MIEVFKTNVQNPESAEKIAKALSTHFGYQSVAFDLEDCDKILRIESDNISNPKVIKLLQELGCQCEVLPD